jgi:hypothetical protein
MASIRIGLGSDFALNNGRLGLGVSDPQVRLEVDGTTKSNDLVVTGVTSFTAYEGFLRADHQIDQDTLLNVGQGLNASLSGEIIVKDGTTVTVGAVGLGTTSVGVGTELITNTIDSNAVNLAGGSEIECLKVFNTFTPPSGGTNERPYAPKPGELYYNYDFKTIEFFDGNGWRQVDNVTRSGRGVHGGGLDPANLSRIDYITISSTGNAQNFGDLTVARNQLGACASSTRGIFAGGQPNTDTIDYITIASGGNAIDFGNTSSTRQDPKGVSSSTRGVFGGGFTPGPTTAVNVIDYIEIATVGNALDFGDLATAAYGHSSCGSPTRGIFLGGNPARGQIIESITISSRGNSVDYGDCDTTTYAGGCSNSVRGIFFGRSPFLATMQYLNIITNGNSSEFGNAHDVNESSACASPIRGVCMSGRDATSPNPALNSISYVEISSLGDAVDFGDLSGIVRLGGSLSDSHGGLGGF